MARLKTAWDLLSMNERALFIKLGLLHGLSDLKDIKNTYNLYANGGSKETSPIKDTSTKEYVVKKWPALGNIDFEVWKDPTFTREKTGTGSIEYFNAKYPGVNYLNGQYVANPSPGKDVIMYDPNTNNEQDVRLDALHIMPKDATYDALNALYRLAALNSDVSYNAKNNYERDKKLYGESNIDSYELYFNNEADGLLRNMFIEGTPLYIESKRYYPNIQQLREWNTHLLPYIDEIHKYMETGLRPSYILPEITVTPNEVLYKNGGNLAYRKDYGGPTDYPEVTIKEEPWVDEYFKNNTNVAGMAIGEGMNGVNGDRRVIINPYNTQMNDSTSRASVLLNERLRHVMDQENFSLPNITKELLQKYNGTSYLGDTLNIGRTEAARYLSGDPSYNLTGSLKLYIDSLKLNYKKSTGGPLYPFSFEKNPFLKTPVVRYDEGGQTYTVKKGDTFSLIAQNVGVSIEDLQKLNPTITNVNRIREGLSINIPPYMFSEIFNTPQSTGLYIPQVLRTQPLQQQNTPILSVEVPTQKGLKTAGPLDLLELAVRQAYTESRLRPDIVNSKGAYGLFQIMLPALDDYNRINKTNYTLEDMKNADNNLKVRNWYMDYLSNLGFIKKGDIQSDSVGMYKVLASFNAGAGHVRDALTKAKADGKDIYDSWDWVSYLWDEPREYSDFILRGIETKGTNKKDSMYNAVSAAKPDITKKIKDSIK